uniref:Uncharacterized protein n=1 Tax=Globodera rostochiensis TaxID=31243 RepID=A0A914GVD1_GLORO
MAGLLDFKICDDYPQKCQPKPNLRFQMTKINFLIHFYGKEIANENVANSNDVMKITRPTKHIELNKVANPEANNNSNFITKAFRFLFGWKSRRAKNRLADEFMPPLESPENQKSERNDSKDDEKVLGQLSESKQKSLLNLIPQLSQLPFYKNKTKHFSESKQKMEKFTENSKPSVGEIKNSYGILMRLFKIKFKRLVDKNDKFVEELLENDYVAELVEKYFKKSGENMANSSGTVSPKLIAGMP